MRTQMRRGLILMGCVAAVACGKKDDSDSDKENDPQPGALMTTMDTAMGSIAFEGQAAGLTTIDSWTDEHCEETGDGTKSEYDGQSDVKWGCLLAVKTDGPDTPRGGVNRLVQLGCEVDRNLESGNMVIDGEKHDFDGIIDPTCWGEDFSEMVAEQLPNNVKADGFAHVDLSVTGYSTVPAEWSDVADEWDVAYEIIFGLTSDESFTYKVLLRDDANGVAASVLQVSDENPNGEVFSMAITRTGGANDEHEFRYEGRFPFAAWGDGSGYGSRHVRILVEGPYAGEGGFESITKGAGYEAGASGVDSSDTVGSASVSTFGASEDGIGTKDFQTDEAGELTGTTTDGVSGINKYTYTGSNTELKAFLTSDIAGFTKATTWFKTQGPIDYDSAKISD